MPALRHTLRSKLSSTTLPTTLASVGSSRSLQTPGLTMRTTTCTWNALNRFVDSISQHLSMWDSREYLAVSSSRHPRLGGKHECTIYCVGVVVYLHFAETHLLISMVRRQMSLS
ncbi:hypothetical protein BDZ89DRAFT_415688 [Hymenopellis radicata]|nr:hypothetical protein BDZ89DRAFT_415688 [Hymenopellis radicata]